MKVILTIKQGNKDERNFTRVLEVAPQEYDYLIETARIINHDGGQQYMGVYIMEV